MLWLSCKDHYILNEEAAEGKGSRSCGCQPWRHVQEDVVLRGWRVREDQRTAQQTSGHHALCHFPWTIIFGDAHTGSSCRKMKSKLTVKNPYNLSFYNLEASYLTGLRLAQRTESYSITSHSMSILKEDMHCVHMAAISLAISRACN